MPAKSQPKVLAVVGARPNFMKVAPIWREMSRRGKFQLCLTHTGQHYDENMSKVFFDDLELPRPDIYMGIGSGAHGEQTGRIMIEFEAVLQREMPDLVIVVGDVNSTMACTLVAVKMGVAVAHVEAGLRSFDRQMPEEINRMVTDILCDLLFTTSPEAEPNLLREGVEVDKIHFVGNVMIDSQHHYRAAAEESTILEMLQLHPGQYGLVTLHRPSNVDDPAVFAPILDGLMEIGQTLPLVFPMHPRTRNMLKDNALSIDPQTLRIVDPLGYLDFLKLMSHASIVLTDSGGIQEETTALEVPCITIRENTERPITVEEGTNTLVGMDRDRIVAEAKRLLADGKQKSRIPDLWDGNAAARIVDVIEVFLNVTG